MKAKSLLRERHDLDARAFAELRMWLVPQQVRGSNEAGKGNHKHVGGLELRYAFETPQKLLSDFWFDVDHWRP